MCVIGVPEKEKEKEKVKRKRGRAGKTWPERSTAFNLS